MVHAHIITPATICVDEAASLDASTTTSASRTSVTCTALLLTPSSTSWPGDGQGSSQEIIAERNARLERERDPGRDRRERFGKLRTLADIMQLLDAEREARQHKKRRRNAQQVQAELRMYARYINEQRRQRREADYRRLAAARQQSRVLSLSASEPAPSADWPDRRARQARTHPRRDARAGGEDRRGFRSTTRAVRGARMTERGKGQEIER